MPIIDLSQRFLSLPLKRQKLEIGSDFNANRLLESGQDLAIKRAKDFNKIKFEPEIRRRR